MKRKLLVITLLWLIALLIVIFFTMRAPDNIDGINKVTINRIHQNLTDDLEKNIKFINDLTEEDLYSLVSVEIIDYQHKTYNEINKFFYDGAIDNKVVFKPIEGTDYIVKYYIEDHNCNNLEVLWFSLVITGAYLYLMIYTLMLHKNIIEPMKKISGITEQLARGYLGEVNLQYKNRYLKDFIWGLDMFRVQLSYERVKNAELEKNQKTLVAGLSHDIKTPLSSIKNYAIALKENIYEEKKDRNKALEIILDKAEVIEKLTNKLLNTSSKEIRNIEVKTKEIYMLEVHKRLDKIITQKTDLLHIDYVKPKLKENLLLIVDLERLQEVFDNIIENAIKYGDLETIKVSYSTEENHQLIEIYNTGSPVPKTEIKYIFNSYYRGSNISDKPGYGLGLYISKQVMKNMQGDIYAKNRTDGVSFIIVIKQVR
ncbi:HAMP domain-containing histidine kinase [Clostridium sp. 'deep sea']|uniref:sensor histidine kinase n=1 Tax=Clostridium sp. 'deep sea' TaxID=2779445 RepID=UPI0018965E48|nr:HAMP domain-containing sensor histidine kinase [Clostridium sp. 'deep sea']QOR34758.1 HAMP domain-containing histidine kinase [Clostridium sp. 'deep sea']